MWCCLKHFEQSKKVGQEKLVNTIQRVLSALLHKLLTIAVIIQTTIVWIKWKNLKVHSARKFQEKWFFINQLIFSVFIINVRYSSFSIEFSFLSFHDIIKEDGRCPNWFKHFFFNENEVPKYWFFRAILKGRITSEKYWNLLTGSFWTI